MRVKLICDCGSAFTLSERVKFHKGDILCPNCGMVLPSGATESIKNFFVSYQKLCGLFPAKKTTSLL